MKKIIYYILVSLSILGIPLFALGLLDLMVSLKYETEGVSDCISHVTGKDLCLEIYIQYGLIAFCFISLITLIVFRKRIFRQ